jgi:hypothetical protein
MPRKSTLQHHERREDAFIAHNTGSGISADRMSVINVVLGLITVACALAVGVLARCKGLRAAPLAVDEYFIVRSTQNVLHHGWPVFDCGGVYSRGLLLQYLAVLLDLLGLPAGVTPRFISAACSLLALPAAFIVGRRVHNATVGWLAVVVLALSVWETEMARFGRMYAPFQTVFLWYLVYFLRRVVDQDRRADGPMIALTLLGTLIWEGGVFLALANFIPPFLQNRAANLSRRDWISLLKFVPVIGISYWFVTTDFRMFGNELALPLDYDPAVADAPANPLSGSPSLWAALVTHPTWFALALVPLAASALAGRTLWLRAEPFLTTAGLAAALASAVAHQFLVAAAVLLLLPLFRFSSWRQLTSPAARRVYMAIGVWLAFWLGVICVSWHRPVGAALWKTVLSFLFPLISLPDFADQILRPWAGAVPVLGAGLLLLVVAGFVRVLRREEPGVSAERAVLALFFCLLLAACASDTPRHETRYVFFLYPVAVVVALTAVASLVEHFAAHRPAALLTSVVGLGAFMLSEDFDLRHLLTIDQPTSIFRSDLKPTQQAHLVVRDNTPALAQWLRRHTAGNGNVVVSAYQSLDYYDANVDFFYVDRSDFNFESYSCRHGTVERWSNRPLLQSLSALAAVISENSATYLVTYSTRVEPLLAQLARYHPAVEWQDGHLAVVAFSADRAPFEQCGTRRGEAQRCST